MATIITFPKKKKKPNKVDFSDIYNEIKKLFPIFFKENEELITKLCARDFITEDFEFYKKSDEPYPPWEPNIYFYKWSLIFSIDMFRRFGGKVVFDDCQFEVNVEKPEYPLFLVNEISKNTSRSVSNYIEDYEYAAFNRDSKPIILLKELAGTDASVLRFTDHKNDRRWVCLADRITGIITYGRLSEGEPPGEVLLFD